MSADANSTAVPGMSELRDSIARFLWCTRYIYLPEASWDQAIEIAANIPDGQAAASLHEMRMQADRLLAGPLAQLQADKDRLDFLDRCNASLNATYGTTYRWQLVMSHNVNRLLLGAGAVDLHDSAAGNTALPSCREAIDRKRAELARDRSIRSSEGASNA